MHGVSASRASLSAGLPLVAGRLTLELAERAAARAGMSARLQRLALDDIDPAALPAVLILADNKACVLQRLRDDDARVLLPETAQGSITLSRNDLAGRYSGVVLFVRPHFRFDQRTPLQRPTRRGHWFWSALLAQRFVYRDVMLAALLVNLFALAFPLFSMNVYDRVVPNNAVETLVGAGDRRHAGAAGRLRAAQAAQPLRRRGQRAHRRRAVGTADGARARHAAGEQARVGGLVRVQPARLRAGARLHRVGHGDGADRPAVRGAVRVRHAVDLAVAGDTPGRGVHRHRDHRLHRAAPAARAGRDHLSGQRAAQRHAGGEPDRHRDHQDAGRRGRDAGALGARQHLPGAHQRAHARAVVERDVRVQHADAVRHRGSDPDRRVPDRRARVDDGRPDRRQHAGRTRAGARRADRRPADAVPGRAHRARIARSRDGQAGGAAVARGRRPAVRAAPRLQGRDRISQRALPLSRRATTWRSTV